MKTLIAIIAFVTLAVSARADIVEIKSMADVGLAINNSTLLVFDIDNTLIEPVQELGSDQWFRDLLNRGVQAGQTQEVSMQNALLKWKVVGRKTQVRPVEAITPEFLDHVQRAGISIIGLTARTADQAVLSTRQLQSVGIDLSVTAGFRNNLPYQDLGAGQGYSYYRGIVFVSPTGDKGQNLLAFLNKTGQHFNRIVFVDDRAQNVQSVSKALDDAHVQNREFRYGGADAHVQTYSPVIADAEWNQFLKTGHIPSDADVSQW
jgi:hypothetical protein